MPVVALDPRWSTSSGCERRLFGRVLAVFTESRWAVGSVEHLSLSLSPPPSLFLPPPSLPRLRLSRSLVLARSLPLSLFDRGHHDDDDDGDHLHCADHLTDSLALVLTRPANGYPDLIAHSSSGVLPFDSGVCYRELWWV
eukprot:3375154-Rhodomonas_salina.1